MSSEFYNESEHDRDIDNAVPVENIISTTSDSFGEQANTDNSRLYAEGDAGNDVNGYADGSAAQYDEQLYHYSSDNAADGQYDASRQSEEGSHEGYAVSGETENPTETTTGQAASTSHSSTSHRQQPGDWICPTCGENNFASRLVCYKRYCETKRPAETMAGYKPNPAHRRDEGRSRYGGGYADRGGRQDRDRERDYRDARAPAYGAGAGGYGSAPAAVEGYGADRAAGYRADAPQDLTWRSLDQKSIANAVNFGDAGDWLCDRCDNHNYASRDTCKRCNQGHKSTDNQRAFDELRRRFGFLLRGDSKRSGMNARHGQRYDERSQGGYPDRGGYGYAPRGDYERDRRYGAPAPHGYPAQPYGAQADYYGGGYGGHAGYGAPAPAAGYSYGGQYAASQYPQYPPSAAGSSAAPASGAGAGYGGSASSGYGSTGYGSAAYTGAYGAGYQGGYSQGR